MDRDEVRAELQKSLADKELKVSEVQADLEKSRSKVEKLTSDNADVTVRLEDRHEQIKDLNNDLKENRDDARVLQAELLKIASKNNGFCLKWRKNSWEIVRVAEYPANNTRVYWILEMILKIDINE